jgi:hypothetical protein
MKVKKIIKNLFLPLFFIVNINAFSINSSDRVVCNIEQCEESQVREKVLLGCRNGLISIFDECCKHGIPYKATITNNNQYSIQINKKCWLNFTQDLRIKHSIWRRFGDFILGAGVCVGGLIMIVSFWDISERLNIFPEIIGWLAAGFGVWLGASAVCYLIPFVCCCDGGVLDSEKIEGLVLHAGQAIDFISAENKEMFESAFCFNTVSLNFSQYSETKADSLV